MMYHGFSSREVVLTDHECLVVQDIHTRAKSYGYIHSMSRCLSSEMCCLSLRETYAICQLTLLNMILADSTLVATSYQVEMVWCGTKRIAFALLEEWSNTSSWCELITSYGNLQQIHIIWPAVCMNWKFPVASFTHLTAIVCCSEARGGDPSRIGH